ncbi:hypothetical protein [uncultured Oscillibacter sp.]|uniref:hypothetical protein n=1 Tax=uncultured Oscillibacter sp. TaxID=876091 RepID=UPI0025DD0C54|nr:hypothetical protein [uncultured Oscillibacter sp.]
MKAPLSVSPAPSTSEYVKVSPASTSVVVSEPTTAFAPLFSDIALFDSQMFAGVSLTPVMLTVSVAEPVALLLSVAVTVKASLWLDIRLLIAISNGS